jgi:hypothetical protein
MANNYNYCCINFSSSPLNQPFCSLLHNLCSHARQWAVPSSINQGRSSALIKSTWGYSRLQRPCRRSRNCDCVHRHNSQGHLLWQRTIALELLVASTTFHSFCKVTATCCIPIAKILCSALQAGCLLKWH